MSSRGRSPRRREAPSAVHRRASPDRQLSISDDTAASSPPACDDRAPLAGDFYLDDEVHFLGRTQKILEYIVEYGTPGRIIGITPKGRLKVHIHAIDDYINCTLRNLSKTPPSPLPGGFNLHDRVYQTCNTTDSKDGSHRFVFGKQCIVAGSVDENAKLVILGTDEEGLSGGDMSGGEDATAAWRQSNGASASEAAEQADALTQEVAACCVCAASPMYVRGSREEA